MALAVNADSLEPLSPCINICQLDEGGFCRGCLRTLAEIASWTSLSMAQRFEVLEAVDQRRRERDESIGGNESWK
jgi:predicted Fe-S protein YdhL (DUF1289 family)